MNAQQHIKRHSVWGLLFIVLFSFFLLPTVSFAEGSAYDCLENKEGCIEEGVDEEENAPNDDVTPVQNSKPKVGLTAGDYIRAFFALIFVVGLLYALLKFMNRKNRLYDKNRLMKNLGGISLGQQKSIQLIIVGDTYYLVGVGEDIRLLKEITDENEIAALLDYYEEAEEIPFQGPMEKLISKLSPMNKKQPKKEGQATEDFSEILNHRLSEIKKERKKQFHRLTEKERGKDD